MTEINTLEKKQILRNPGIEALKIAAVLFIIVSHVTQTIGEANSYIPYHAYVIDMWTATTDPQVLLLAFMRHFGVVGNSIFFVCSAFFLVDSRKMNAQKWFFLAANVWAVSVLILIVVFAIRSGDVAPSLIITSLLPNTLGSNWYMTCYLIFYPLHPFLNKLIFSLNQKQMLRITFFLVFLYIGCNFLKGLFFSSLLILWVTIYFAIAYLKLYLPEFMNSRRKNVICLMIGLAGWIGLFLFTDFLGLHSAFFSNKLLKWVNNCNPFILLCVLASFNLVRQKKTTLLPPPFINSVAGLSMLIYIVHENTLLRTYYRTAAVNYIYQHFGYRYIVLWDLLLSLTIFAVTVVICAIYRATLQKVVGRLSRIICSKIGSLWLQFEDGVLSWR